MRPPKASVVLDQARKNILMGDWVVEERKIRAARAYYDVAGLSSRDPVI